MLKQSEIEKIKRGIELMNASTNDKGEIVFLPFRMCGFLWTNTPILIGILCSKPTMFNTFLWQIINQSYNAGLNFANKNSSCSYTQQDIINGYFAAVIFSLSISLNLRYFLRGLTAQAVGNQLLLLNTIVGSAAGA
jgi:hypothetical protein